jgi:NitT/TauT family transport system substrate-binding protein
MRLLKDAVGLLAVLMSIALVLAACSDGTQTASEPSVSSLRVALFPGGSTLPAHVALTNGYFERNNLRVEITEGQELPILMAALAKGQYDIVMTVPTLALIGAEKHLDLQIVAGLQHQSEQRPNAVWITRDPSIESLAQLRGKSIAVPSLTGLVTDALVYLLQRSGVGRRDVRLVQTPFPTMGDQLAAGHVDAAIATIPFVTAIAARGFRLHDDVIVEAVREASDGTIDTAITSVWLASRTFGRQHPETIAAWREALTEATDFLESNESQARAAMSDWLKIPAQVLERSPLPDWDVEISPDELAPYITISRAVGSTTTDPDVNSLVWQGP